MLDLICIGKSESKEHNNSLHCIEKSDTIVVVDQFSFYVDF